MKRVNTWSAQLMAGGNGVAPPASAQPRPGASAEVIIEKNVPLPPRSHGRVPRQFPFDKMEVGDSFVVTPDEAIKLDSLSAMIHARRIRYVAAHPGTQFTTRIDREKVSIRCWRIA